MRNPAILATVLLATALFAPAWLAGSASARGGRHGGFGHGGPGYGGPGYGGPGYGGPGYGGPGHNGRPVPGPAGLNPPAPGVASNAPGAQPPPPPPAGVDPGHTGQPNPPPPSPMAGANPDHLGPPGAPMSPAGPAAAGFPPRTGPGPEFGPGPLIGGFGPAYADRGRSRSRGYRDGNGANGYGGYGNGGGYGGYGGDAGVGGYGGYAGYGGGSVELGAAAPPIAPVDAGLCPAGGRATARSLDLAREDKAPVYRTNGGTYGQTCTTLLRTCPLPTVFFLGESCSCSVPGGRSGGHITP